MEIWDDAFGLMGDAFGAVGDGVKSVFDIGKNTQRVTPFSQDKNYNPNAFQYGGREGYADQAANRYAGLAAGAQGRGASLADYAQADQYAGLGLGARGQQQQVANMMMARAQGLTPSIASMQAQQDMQRAVAAQGALAASARGAGGLALAQQTAANNIANAQGAISGQAQIAGAQERMAAENAALGGFAGLRAGDVASQQQAAGQAQFQAQQQAQQRAQNDQYSAQLMNNEMAVRQQQLQGQIQHQQTLANNSLGAQQQQSVIGQNNATMDMNQARFVLGVGQGGADTHTAMNIGNGSDDRMKSGLTPLSGYGSSDELKMGLTPLGNLAPVPVVADDPTSSWKQAAQHSKMSAGALTGLSPSRVAQIQNPTGKINSFDPNAGGGLAGGFLSDDRAKLQAAYDAGARSQREWQKVNSEPWTTTDEEGDPNNLRQEVAETPHTRGRDMTAQLAHGLAPYAYEYKPGMGPPGPQVGPRAQLMASQPATATAVTQRPDGLLQIDPAGGTKTALAGVGQLAQDMQAVKSYLAGLRKEGGR